MGQQIIQQPDGLFAVFSSITDSFIVTEATQEELVEWRAQEAADAARVSTRAELKRVLDPENKRPYAQFTLSWEEASRQDQE